jgi:hypothetical protein
LYPYLRKKIFKNIYKKKFLKIFIDMPTTRPFAFNTGTTISGTTQIGSLAIGVSAQDYSSNPGGVKWWMGPDEEPGYIIGLPVPAQNHPTPVGNIGGVEFWRSSGFTDAGFLSIVNSAATRRGYSGMTNTIDAYNWISSSGFTTWDMVPVTFFDNFNSYDEGYLAGQGRWEAYSDPSTVVTSGKTIAGDGVNRNYEYVDFSDDLIESEGWEISFKIAKIGSTLSDSYIYIGNNVYFEFGDVWTYFFWWWGGGGYFYMDYAYSEGDIVKLKRNGKHLEFYVNGEIDTRWYKDPGFTDASGQDGVFDCVYDMEWGGYDVVFVAFYDNVFEIDDIGFKYNIISAYTNEHTLVLTFDLLANASGMIGGDATLLADWNLAFGSPASPFTRISVVGDVVILSGGSDITVPDSLFSTDWDSYGHLISIVDTGCIVAAGYNSFGDLDESINGIELETAIMPALISAGKGCFYYSGTRNLVNVSFPLLEVAGDSCFYYQPQFNASLPSLKTAGAFCFYTCVSFTGVNILSLETVGNGCFLNCTSLSFIDINLPSLIAADTSLGGTAGDDEVFGGVTGKAVTNLTVPAYFATNNAGGVDGDIAYLIANNTIVNITYV